MTQQKAFNYKIEPEHVDFQKNISPITLADMILNAAGSDANEYGFGLMDLHQKNCSWVVSRFAMKLDSIPTVGNSLSIETWVKDVGNVFTTRNFRILNGVGNVIGYSALSWAIIDLDTRKALPINSFPKLNEFIVDEEIPMPAPSRVPDIEGVVANKFQVRYSDIDLNVHTNVLKYLQGICDCFSLDFYTKHVLKSVEINFLKELEYGDKGAIYYEKIADNEFLFKMVTKQGIVVSRSRMVFEKG